MSVELPEYGYAHKGGEGDEAYYTAYLLLPDDCSEAIAKGVTCSGAISAIHAHARAAGSERYLILDQEYSNGEVVTAPSSSPR